MGCGSRQPPPPPRARQGPLPHPSFLLGCGYQETPTDRRYQLFRDGGTTLGAASGGTPPTPTPPPPSPALALPTSGAAGKEPPLPPSGENESVRGPAAHTPRGPMAAPSPTSPPRSPGAAPSPTSPPRSPGAAPSPPAELPSEASCPICRGLFQDPVSIHCGHNFCRGCISRCWEGLEAPFSCPRCREAAPERSLRPSRELARVLEVACKLHLLAAGAEDEEEDDEEEEDEGCPKHREPLRLFCPEDGALLCAVCRESRAHRAHSVLPLPEAARDAQGQIQAGLEALRADRDKLLGVREAEMRRNWEFLEKMEAERQRVLSRFEGLRLFLEAHAHRLLAQLEQLERDLEKVQEENVTSLTQEISRLDALIQEVEEKCQQPPDKLLQSLTSSFSRLEQENFQEPPLLLPDLEKKINLFREKNIIIEETLRSFQDILMFELPEKMQVTLDPSTAHPQLVVSQDSRTVRWEAAQQDPSPEGPCTEPCVLGCQGITSGRHCWEVEVAPKGSWALGVAREPLKGPEDAMGPEMELWSMGLCQGQFWALTSLERIPLYQIRVPSRVRVSLDYEKGQVAFFDADKRVLIFAFPAASFKGESVRPWFLVWSEGSQISLCP
ncbi:E3 ubiquitin-protein ligase TRIM7-like [Porphyrio hochstetteri]